MSLLPGRETTCDKRAEGLYYEKLYFEILCLDAEAPRVAFCDVHQDEDDAATMEMNEYVFVGLDRTKTLL